MFTWAVLSCAVACITEFHGKTLVLPKNGKMNERKVKVCVYKRERGGIEIMQTYARLHGTSM